jgi:hypothetical protein
MTCDCVTFVSCGEIIAPIEMMLTFLEILFSSDLLYWQYIILASN